MGRSWRSTSPLFLRNIQLVLRTEEGFCRVFPAGSKISLSSLSPLEGKGKLYSLTFFGAKKKKRFSLTFFGAKKKKRCFLLSSARRKKQRLVLFLAQEKNEKNIHPNQAFPYMGRM